MKIVLPLFSVFASALAQSLTERYNFHDSVLNLLRSHFENPERITNHGCWCAKLDPANNIAVLGGPSPLDALDRLCKRYFTQRNCLNKLPHSLCDNFGVDNLYDVTAIASTDGSVQFECQAGSHECNLELCQHDVEFVEAVRNLLDGPLGNASAIVAEVGTCEAPTGAGMPKLGTSIF